MLNPFNRIQLLTNMFSQTIQDTLIWKENYLACPDKDFSRSSVLGLPQTIECVYRLHGECADSVILSALEDNRISYDVRSSAFTQRRSKISSNLFKDVFYTTLTKLQKALPPKLVNGYQIVAVDGSESPLYGRASSDPAQADLFVAKTKNGCRRRFLHVNAAYNISTQQFKDFIFQPGSLKNEDKALLELVDTDFYRNQKVIVVADRGYESLINFYRMQQKKIKFVIRIKDKESKTAITRNIPLPDSPAFDMPYSVLLSSRSGWREHDGKPVKYISNHKNIPEFDNQTYLPLDLRIVRIAVPKADGGILWEMLITNLDADEFSAEDLREIYHLRWDIETGFRDLKCTLGIKQLHSRKPDLIMQEIYAAAAIYNLSSTIRRILESTALPSGKGQYTHKINFAFLCKAILYQPPSAR